MPLKQSHRARQLAAVEPLEDRHLLAGVTVLNHGFQPGGDVPDWLFTMGQAILDRADGARTDRTQGSIFQHDPSTGAWESLPDSIWTNSNDPHDHVVLVYDWAEESGAFQDGWLSAAADNLFASLLKTNDELPGLLSGTRFVDLARQAADAPDVLDLHFVGHSRGAVLNSLVVERFATYFEDTNIDHVTSLDPHPASLMNDPGYVASNPSANSRLFTYPNVVFADNYYRQDFLYELDGDFDGVPAEGAYNLRIPESVLSGQGSAFEHSDVHTWYYGTITEPFDPTYTGYAGAGRNHDGDVSFPESWYDVSGVPPRNAAGFALSTIAAGDRSGLMIDGLPVPPSALPTVFNGDFAFGYQAGVDEVPGWGFHGGAFEAAYENGRARLFNAAESPVVTISHNALYIPQWSQSLEFQLEVVAPSANDALNVFVGGDTTPLAAWSLTTAGPLLANIPFPAALRGSVSLLKFQLDGGSSIEADLFIDNVALIPTEPATGDFDRDGQLDCADIDQLVAAIAKGDSELRFDITGDELVNLADLDAWLQFAGAANLPSGNAYPRGDANLDGAVDVSDFNLWNANKFTNAASWCRGDFNADGFIDVSDFNTWNLNKFTTAASALSGQPLVSPSRRPVASSTASLRAEAEGVEVWAFGLDGARRPWAASQAPHERTVEPARFVRVAGARGGPHAQLLTSVVDVFVADGDALVHPASRGRFSSSD